MSSNDDNVEVMDSPTSYNGSPSTIGRRNNEPGIRAKALLIVCAHKTMTLRTKDGEFVISPKLAQKLLKD